MYSVRLGFLPRNVAKWVAPLSDSGLFKFSVYVYSKEVLVTALEGSTIIVQMILYVSQTFLFRHIKSSAILTCFCNMFISCINSEVYRPLATSRGTSSIGSVTSQFLAAFSTASGKISVQFSESKESDPDKTWQRLRNIGILHDAIPYPNDRVNHPLHVK
ncbi:unnamed protein product [Camellia sinensis]